MNWNATAAIAEIIAAIAVILSLIYLSAQVRASTRQASTDAVRDLAKGVSDLSLSIAANSELSMIFVSGLADFDALSPEHQLRFRALCNSLFRVLEQQFLLREHGDLNEEAWHGVSNMLADFAQLPGVRQYFTDRGHWYAPSFVRYLQGEAGLEPMGERTSLKATYVNENPSGGAL